MTTKKQTKRNLFTQNQLATMLSIDRRTLRDRMASIEPDEVSPQGYRLYSLEKVEGMFHKSKPEPLSAVQRMAQNVLQSCYSFSMFSTALNELENELSAEQIQELKQYRDGLLTAHNNCPEWFSDLVTA